MTKLEVVAALRAANPYASDTEVHVFASALLEHRAAQANIDENGTIVFHPTTAAPITNPFVAVRDSTARTLLKLGLKTGDLWR